VVTTGSDHDRWLDELLDWARRNGMSGRRALDVAGGTGAGFVPPPGHGLTVRRHDLRRLPVPGRFDLVACLGDALNHLLSEDEVVVALGSLRHNLAPGGVLMLSINTVVAYRAAFAHADVFEVGEHVFAWRSVGTAGARAGCIADIQVDVFGPSSGDPARRRRMTSSHRERHYPADAIERLIASAGMDVVDRRGQSPGSVLHDELDERRHAKALFLARRSDDKFRTP
jgi:SAM-dependent methyltransferase